MRHFLFAFLCAIFHLIFAISSVSAHLLGQPPYFKVDGVYSEFYPVLSYSTRGGILPPQDIATGVYVAGMPLSFELEKKQLATIIPLEIVEKTKFIWEFGDGGKASGFANTHTYTKPGSYIATIYADTTTFEKGVEPQLLQSTFITVLPTRDYKIPQAKITVNGNQISQDSVTGITNDVFEVVPGSIVSFDASDSIQGTARIDSYIWDFGDGESAIGTKVTHTYKSPVSFVSPSLRIVDANGFISETSVGIKETDNFRSDESTGSTVVSIQKTQPIIVIGIVIAIALIFFIVFRKKRRYT